MTLHIVLSSICFEPMYHTFADAFYSSIAPPKISLPSPSLASIQVCHLHTHSTNPALDYCQLSDILYWLWRPTSHSPHPLAVLTGAIILTSIPALERLVRSCHSHGHWENIQILKEDIEEQRRGGQACKD